MFEVSGVSKEVNVRGSLCFKRGKCLRFVSFPLFVSSPLLKVVGFRFRSRVHVVNLNEFQDLLLFVFVQDLLFCFKIKIYCCFTSPICSRFIIDVRVFQES